MGISLASQFDVQTGLPLDSRDVVADNTARDAILSGRRYIGMKVYSIADAKTYQLQAGITNSDWVDITAAGAATATAGITAFAGGGQASATALPSDINQVSVVATAGDSVKLPAATAGKQVIVINDGANSCDIFPQTGEQIDALGANIQYPLATTDKNVRFICAVAGTWKSAAGGGSSSGTTSGTYRASATISANQSIPNNTTTTIIWNSTIYDPLLSIDTSTGIVTVKESGDYIILAQLFFGVPLSSTPQAYAFIEINGSTTRYMGGNTSPTSGASGNYFVPGFLPVTLNSGDTFKIQANQNTGAARDLIALETNFSITRAGPLNVNLASAGIAAVYELPGATSITANVAIALTTKVFDDLNIYNTSTGELTVPAGGAGDYYLGLTVNQTVSATYYVKVNTSGKGYFFSCGTSTTDHGAVILRLSDGDKVTIYSDVSATSAVAGTQGSLYRLNFFRTGAAVVGTQGISRVVQTVTSTLTGAATASTDYVYLLGAGAVFTMPTAVGNENRYTIKNVDSSNKTVSFTGGQTGDGSSTLTLTPNTSLDLVSNNTNWSIL